MRRPSQRWRRFATLETHSAVLEADTMTFVLRDPVDNARHGWRWEIAPDRLDLIDVHLMEELDTSEPTEPDEDGVRW